MNFERTTYEIYVYRNPDIVRKMITPLTEKEYKFEQILAKEYECPVCYQSAQPPIMMCSNSHIICLECWRQCVRCPTCRTLKTFTRAFSLEKLHPLISFPCTFEGCSFRATGSYTGIHEHFCPHFPIRCPLAEAYDCQWLGNMKSVQEHLVACHPDNTFFESRVLLRSRLFARCLTKTYNIIFVIKDRLFKLDWNYDLTQSPKVRFRLITIGNGNPIVMYSFTIIIAKKLPIGTWSRTFKLYTSQVKRTANDCSVVNRRLDQPIQYNFDDYYYSLLPLCVKSDLLYSVDIEPSHINTSLRGIQI